MSCIYKLAEQMTNELLQMPFDYVLYVYVLLRQSPAEVLIGEITFQNADY